MGPEGVLAPGELKRGLAMRWTRWGQRGLFTMESKDEWELTIRWTWWGQRGLFTTRIMGKGGLTMRWTQFVLEGFIHNGEQW